MTFLTVLKRVFETAYESFKLVKKSYQCDSKLKQIKQENKNEMKSGHAFCPTRWAVQGETLSSLLNNFEELLNN